MFSGIIEEQGIITRVEPTGLTIQARHVLEGSEIKDSIAIDGVCLTVTEYGNDWFHVDTMPETLRRTRLGQLAVGSPVNLERSLLATARIGGHMVQGHVEAAVPVLSVKVDGIALQVEIVLPEYLCPYIVSKGYVALNGASLTVISATKEHFSIALIPYTREHTNLGIIEPGTLLNVETDILGRYVVQFLQEREKNLV
ncbi:MAG: riboflavin synthase [Ktedonobacteraceae bacterium]